MNYEWSEVGNLDAKDFCRLDTRTLSKICAVYSKTHQQIGIYKKMPKSS